MPSPSLCRNGRRQIPQLSGNPMNGSLAMHLSKTIYSIG
jgi:hypothetical protein